VLRDHTSWYVTFKVKARPVKKADVETPIDQFVLPDDHDYEALAVAQLHIISDRPSSLSPPPESPVLKPKPRLSTPTPDPYGPGLCEDDEDLYFARLALAESMGIPLPYPAPKPTTAPDRASPSPFCVHRLLGQKATTRSHMRRSPHMLHSMRPVVPPPTLVNHKHNNLSPR
jgi:hypothetical protein